MTCILSTPALYTNQFNDSGEDIQKNICENFDFRWISAHHPNSGLCDNQICHDSCHDDSNASSSVSYLMDISKGLTAGVEPEHSKTEFEGDFAACDSEKHDHTDDKHNATKCQFMRQDTYAEVGLGDMNVKLHGVKRKATEEVYMPSKRVSPFLNTPKQRRDERKKILEISIKKLKQLDDPEAFLRRTVLINNVTKCLQTELRQEKYGTNHIVSHEKPFSRCGVFNNNCMLDTILFDDPFSSGVHEKITDDMTDTLINNVFHDKLNDNLINESDIGEKSDIKVNEMEVDHEQLCILSRACRSLKRSEENSGQCSVDETPSSHSCGRLTCLDNSTDTKETYPGIYDDLCEENKCFVNKCAGNYKPVCHFNNTTVNICECNTNSTGNVRAPSRELGKHHSDQSTECDKMLSAEIVNLKKSIHILVNCADTAQKYLCTDKHKSHLISKGAINVNNCSLDHLEHCQNLDPNSLSHSVSSFSSVFDISDSI